MNLSKGQQAVIRLLPLKLNDLHPVSWYNFISEIALRHLLAALAVVNSSVTFGIKITRQVTARTNAATKAAECTKSANSAVSRSRTNTACPFITGSFAPGNAAVLRAEISHLRNHGVRTSVMDARPQPSARARISTTGKAGRKHWRNACARIVTNGTAKSICRSIRSSLRPYELLKGISASIARSRFRSFPLSSISRPYPPVEITIISILFGVAVRATPRSGLRHLSTSRPSPAIFIGLINGSISIPKH